MKKEAMTVRTRIAPSPTGDLHFGSLLAAVASFLQAKARGGEWLLRVDDIDPPREVPGSADRIIRDLQRFGMHPDGPVLYQSRRTPAYEAARDRLLESGLAFWCGCSRAELPRSGVYPGTCRAGLPPGKAPRAVRLRVGPEPVFFEDKIQGPIREDLQETIGDFDDVEVIEVHISAGDAVEVEDALITLETDKASMDVPAEVGGRIVSVAVAVGDKVSKDSPIDLPAVTCRHP